jgi:hypothetical protein
MCKRRLFAFPALILLVTLTSCDPVVIETRTPTPLTGLQATFAINQTKNANYSATQVALNTQSVLHRNLTITARPTSTPRPTPSQTPKPTHKPHTLTPSITPTLFPFPTPEGWWNYEISQNREWIAWELCCDDIGHIYVLIENSDNTISWAINLNLEIHNNFCNFGCLFKIAHWSIDNNYLYIAGYPSDGHWAFKPAAVTIIELSLETGSIKYILEPTYKNPSNPEDGERLFCYGFSQDSQWLTYEICNEGKLFFYIMNLNTNQVKSFNISVSDDHYCCDISWSPNNQYFVFSISEDQEYIDVTENFSVFLVNIETLQVKKILSEYNKFLKFPEWISDTEILYSYYDFEKSATQQLILNIETGEITEMDE